MNKYDVILTEAGNNVGYQAKKSLTARGLKVCVSDVAGSGMDFLTSHPVKCEEGFIRTLLAKCEETGARMIMPMFHPEILARHRDAFPEGIIIATDEAGKLALLDDKASASRLASSIGIPQPRIYDSPEEVESYPVVFKRPQGLGGCGVYFPKSKEALEKLLRTGKDNLVMEYVEGYDCSVDALIWDGHFIASAYRVLEPHRKGISTLRRSIEAPEMISYARQILEVAGYRGVCGVDFRVRAQDGKPLFLECNPRLSGGISSTIASGIDAPWLLWKLWSDPSADTGSLIDNIKVKTGLVTGTAAEIRRHLWLLPSVRKVDKA